MKRKTIFFCLLFTGLFIFFINSNICFASTPKLINKLTSAFDDIQGWLLKLATPAAAVAVGVGLFMKKFSFGDEEKIRAAKKVIRGSLIAYRNFACT